MDLIKIQYFKKKMNSKVTGMFVTAMNEEVIIKVDSRFHRNVTTHFEKYRIPNAMFYYLRLEDIFYALKGFSKDLQ